MNLPIGENIKRLRIDALFEFAGSSAGEKEKAM